MRTTSFSSRTIASEMFSSPAGSPLSSTSVSLLNVSSRRGLHNTSRATPGLSNRSLRAEQAIKETEHHAVKALNSPVPVQVQEALRGDLSNVSVKLHVSGWAWLVCGNSNRVLLWRFTPGETGARCFQLSLPSHSTAWNADLITVCGQISITCVGVLAVSSDGHLHYWDNALRDRSVPSYNGTVDIGSANVMIIRPIIENSRAIIFTTEGSLLLLHLPSSSQPALSTRALHAPQGILSGFGRRMSSLFFGSSAMEHTAEGRSMVVMDTQDGRSSHLFALVTTSLLLLQRWVIDNGREQMMYEMSLEPILSASVLQNNWFTGQQGSLTVWSVDVALAQNHVVVLFAVSPDNSSVAEYGLALFDAHHDSAPLSPDDLIRLNRKISHQQGGNNSLYSLSLHCSPSSPSITVLDRNTLLLSIGAIATGDNTITDVVHFLSSTVILGTGLLDGNVVLFTTTHGVISIHLTSPLHPPPSSSPSPLSHTTSIMMTPTLTSQQRLPVSLSPEAVSGAVEKLKKSFLEYLEGNISEATSCSHQLFPVMSYSENEGLCDGLCDGLGDIAVKTLSEMVLNDQPALGPRWGETKESLTGGSLIIIYQLENKQTAHMRLVDFIADCGLLKKLSCVTERGEIMRTTHLLCEHAEKIAAAITLRKKHNQVVDEAMSLCVTKATSHSSYLRPGLSHQDIFYTELIHLDTIFPSLLSLIKSRLKTLSHPKERLQLVLSACSPVEEMLREAVQFRQTKSSLFSPPLPPDPSSLPPFIPWTASCSSSGVRKCLRQFLEILCDVVIQDGDTQQEAVILWRVAGGLCDVLLGGYLDQIHSMEHNSSLATKLVQVRKEFVTMRERFLAPLLEYGQYDQGIDLAERYHDFHLLVQLCEKAGDKDRLKGYVIKFSEQGFAEFLFKRLLDQGQLEELLSYSEDFPEQLDKFLEPHDHIIWLHYVTTEDYPQAYATLRRLALKEEKLLARKKTLLGLSKLALLVSGSGTGNGNGNEEVEELNRELSVIKYQEDLPSSVLEAAGIEDAAPPPLPLEDIVKLYVGDHNRNAVENDFLNALRLILNVFKDKKCEDFIELKTYIWSQAVLRDNWSQMSTDNPLNQLPQTVLFKVLQLAFYKGFNLAEILPTIDSLLTSPSLVDAGVAQDAQFKFLVSAGFEQLERVHS